VAEYSRCNTIPEYQFWKVSKENQFVIINYSSSARWIRDGKRSAGMVIIISCPTRASRRIVFIENKPENIDKSF